MRCVREIMDRKVLTADPDETLLSADRKMRRAHVRHLPVERDGVLVGLLSHRDLFDWTAPTFQPTGDYTGETLRGVAVERVMRRAPYTATQETTLPEAATRLLRYGIGCLPVVEGSDDAPRLIGIVVEADLVRAAYVPSSPS